MRSALLLLAALLVPGTALAQTEIDPSELDDVLRAKARTVQHMALNPAVIRAVRRQNAEELSLTTIMERDQAWKKPGRTSQFQRELQLNPAGRFLKAHVRDNPAFVEAFVTDAQGANVAVYPLTSDYYQGDEDKWASAFDEGRGRVRVGTAERDASTGASAVQISAPVMDKGRAIGVLVVGVTTEYLNAAQAAGQR